MSEMTDILETAGVTLTHGVGDWVERELRTCLRYDEGDGSSGERLRWSQSLSSLEQRVLFAVTCVGVVRSPAASLDLTRLALEVRISDKLCLSVPMSWVDEITPKRLSHPLCIDGTEYYEISVRAPEHPEYLTNAGVSRLDLVWRTFCKARGEANVAQPPKALRRLLDRSSGR